jgi:large subunit ribosomal protein L22
VLAFTQRAAAREVDRVLRSAVANAESAHGLDGDELLVHAAYADEGPTLKRWQPRARGRAGRIMKRTCHITIVLAENPKATSGRPRRGAKPTAQAEPAPAVEETEPPAGEETPPEETPAAKAPRKRAPAKKKETAV